LKSGSLNLLEPSGPVQACNGIALPLPLPLQSAKAMALGFTARKSKFIVSEVRAESGDVSPKVSRFRRHNDHNHRAGSV